MIKFDNTEVFNFEGAIRGMRNAKNSWDKADSLAGCEDSGMIPGRINDFVNNMLGNDIEADLLLEPTCAFYAKNCILNPSQEGGSNNFFLLGQNDLQLAQTLAAAGTDHGKFLRQIGVCVDITAPLFWWKEFDTYKIGTVANSTSTMHTIANAPITMNNFSFECMFGGKEVQDVMCDMITMVTICETYRKKYLENKDTNPELAKQYWRVLIELLPNGWLQTRTVTLNYAVLRNIYFARKHHKLTEWHKLCAWIESLPYAKQLITYEVKKNEG